MSREFALEVLAGMPPEARERFELRIAIDAHSSAVDVRFCAGERRDEVAAQDALDARFSGLIGGISESTAETLTAILELRKK